MLMMLLRLKQAQRSNKIKKRKGVLYRAPFLRCITSQTEQASIGQAQAGVILQCRCKNFLCAFELVGVVVFNRDNHPQRVTHMSEGKSGHPVKTTCKSANGAYFRLPLRVEKCFERNRVSLAAFACVLAESLQEGYFAFCNLHKEPVILREISCKIF